MKTIVKIALFMLFFAFLLGMKGVKASDEYTKTIKKEFSINPDAQVTINNKFGKIQCLNWDKNVVSIEVQITVTASSEEAAERQFKGITIDMNGTPELVNAVTNISDLKGKPRKSYFSIDYTVNLPSTVSVDLTNKFGDIYLNEISGKGKINLGYGSLDVKKLGNSDNLLDIRFSKARVNWIKGAVVVLKYSEMDVDYAGSLRLDSKFSDLDANKIIALNVNFEGGKLKMENSSAVDSRSRFSDLKISRLEQSLNLDIQYGSCDIREMPASFTSINIRNKYANVEVGLPKDAKYALDAELKFCELDFPDDIAKFSFRSVENTGKKYRGVVGTTEETPPGRIVVRSEFGNVSLQ